MLWLLADEAEEDVDELDESGDVRIEFELNKLPLLLLFEEWFTRFKML